MRPYWEWELQDVASTVNWQIPKDTGHVNPRAGFGDGAYDDNSDQHNGQGTSSYMWNDSGILWET